MNGSVLQAIGISKRYGALVAVNHLDLDIHQGEIFGFLGPNGAGKTTSINMICGLMTPDSGEVRVHGIPIRDRDGIHRRIGVCPQEIILWERLTCMEQLQFVAALYRVPPAAARRRAEELMGEMGLEEKRDTQARKLSGGMQRKLNLLMALIHDPEIVILDEPEAGLDPQSRVRVRQYIQSLARRKTVVLTTHNMDEADRVADRVAIIDHGELLRLGTPEELKHTIGKGDIVEMRLLAGESRLEGSIDAIRRADPAAEARLDGDMLAVRALDAVTSLPAYLDALRQSGLRAAEVRIRENTLEDVFLQLTGRSLRA